MKRVLIGPGQRINDIVDPVDEFEVHPSLLWVDGPDDVSPNTHDYDGETFVLRPPVVPPTKREALDADLERSPVLKALLHLEASKRGVGVDVVIDELEAVI